jgi:hypothetical protein
MDKQTSHIVSKVCSIPRDFHICTNKSMVQLLKESGYPGSRDSITKEEIIRALKTNQDFICDWLDYSDGQRISSGWFFQYRNSENWVVGYFNGNYFEKEQVFTSGYEACAVFILTEVERISKHLY